MGWGGVGPFEAALDILPRARGQGSLRPTSWWWSSPLPHPQDTEGLGDAGTGLWGGPYLEVGSGDEIQGGEGSWP